MNSKCNHVIGNDDCGTHHNNNWQDNIEEAVSSRRHFSEIVEENECLTDRVDSWQYKDVTSAVGLANPTELANMKKHSHLAPVTFCALPKKYQCQLKHQK